MKNFWEDKKKQKKQGQGTGGVFSYSHFVSSKENVLKFKK